MKPLQTTAYSASGSMYLNDTSGSIGSRKACLGLFGAQAGLPYITGPCSGGLAEFKKESDHIGTLFVRRGV